MKWGNFFFDSVIVVSFLALISALHPCTSTNSTPPTETPREHAWGLFTQLVLGQDYPAWKDWCAIANNTVVTKGKRIVDGENVVCPHLPTQDANHFRIVDARDITDAIQALSRARLLLSGRPLRQQPEADFALSADPGKSSILETSEVLLNRDLASAIEPCFYDRQKYTLPKNGLINFDVFHLGPPRTDASRTLCAKASQAFEPPATSISVKTAWAAVAFPDGPDKRSDPIPIWSIYTDYIKTPLPIYRQPSASNWNTNAKIVKGGTCDPRLVIFNKLQDDPATVPLSCFYSVRVSKDDLNNALRLLGISQGAIQPPPFNQDMYFILLGFHVATKQMEGWTWQTFWWSGTSSMPADGSGKDNPVLAMKGPVNAADARWAHYDMAATYGHKLDYTSSLDNVAMNPYIEGPGLNGPASNCYNCHRYARYHTAVTSNHKSTTPEDYFEAGLGLGFQNCDPSTPPAQDGSQLQRCKIDQMAFIQTGTPTSFLWSVADSNKDVNGHKSMPFLFDQVERYFGKLTRDNLEKYDRHDAKKATVK
jgi:hypothetical protein